MVHPSSGNSMSSIVTTQFQPQTENQTLAEQPLDDLTLLVGQLFEQYASAICAYLHSLLGDWEAARELTQETYLELMRTRQRLVQVENQRAWVYRIATHLALNERKRRRRFAWLPWGNAQSEPQFTWHDLESEIDRRAAVEQALVQLAPEYRAPLLLFSSYGLSIREVATVLDLHEGAVKTRLHRARELFRQAYVVEESREL